MADRISARACGSQRSPKARRRFDLFARQAIPMVWDFAEVNAFCGRRRRRRQCNRDRRLSCRAPVLDHSRQGRLARQTPTQTTPQTAGSSRLIRRITTTSGTPTCLTSSTSGFAARCGQCSRSLRHGRRPQGRGIGRDAVPTRRQGEGRGVLPRGDDSGDASAGRASASGVSRHHLLRVQASGKRD